MKHKTILRKSACAVLAASFILGAGATVYAADPLPSAGDVLRDSRQTERKLPERQTPNVTVEQIKPPMANDQSLKVFVKSYQFTGQDLFSQDELTGLLTTYTNKDMTMASLQEAAEVITKHFRAKGYFVAQAYLPQQDITEGNIEIAVIIGRYGDLILKNKTVVSDSAIRRQLSALKNGDYIQTANIERATLLAGDMPGVAIKATLTPGKTAGTSDVVIEATPKGAEWQSYVSANNYGSRLNGYNKVNLSTTYSNPFRQGDRLIGNISRSNNSQDTGDIYYQIPVAEGSTLNLSYSKVNYELGEEFAGTGYSGTAYTKHVDWTYALRRSRVSNQYIQFGYDHKKLEDINPSEPDNAISRMVTLGLSGDSSDTLWGGGANSYSIIYYNGSTSSGSPPSGSWNKTTYSFMRQQYLDDRLALFVSLSGQRSDSNLDSSEKFSLGGPNGVRAYPVSEASGDEAYLTTAELRYTVPAAQKGSIWQLSAFYDHGVSNLQKHSLKPDDNRRSLSGVGIGVQYVKPSDYAIKATYAWRVGNNEPQADTTFGNGHLWLQAMKYF